MLGVFEKRDKLGERLVVVLQGLPCGWGRCVFCPFSREQSCDVIAVARRNRAILEEAASKLKRKVFKRLTLLNGGSFYELPYDTITRLSGLTSGLVVDIESRPEYLDEEAVTQTLRHLGASRLVIRVGFEVWDEYKRNIVLGKGIPQSEVERLARLRPRLKEKGLPVEFLVYVLFGIEGISERDVVESVEVFNKLFDGVIAVRYRRYPGLEPRETPVSPRLLRLLQEKCILVDMAEGDEWVIEQQRQ